MIENYVWKNKVFWGRFAPVFYYTHLVYVYTDRVSSRTLFLAALSYPYAD